MRARKRVVIFLVMLIVIGLCAGVAASQTGSKAASQTTTERDDDDEGGNSVRGQADSGPAFTGMVIGLLLIAMISLFFAVYMRDRH